MPPFNPSLPEDLIAQFKSDPKWKDSTIFTKDFETFRTDALKRSKDRCSFEMEVALVGCDLASRRSDLERNLEKFRPGDGKTFLHLALKHADVPLAYEIIRIGIDINFKDTEGVTPLFYALEHLLALHEVYKAVTQPGFRKPTKSAPQSIRTALDPDNIKTRMGDISKIAILIIEQHANVDAGAFGYTPISLAAQAQQWDLVRLLLRHGARHSQSQISSTADRIRLSSIMNEVKASSPRPAQPCPCWSGKLLSECHDSSRQPYPDHFLCGCVFVDNG
ncbi:hypothetical protein VKT23_005237 [Stygiomarasmius scandens]|uniref:Uncharacterized protein n=1 Tax=Marasmiellus scandens TaxID=2682957 RepID=A0ABR1JS87_9AGAR